MTAPMSSPSRSAPAPGPYARPLGPVAAAGWSAAFLVVFALAMSVLGAVRPGSQPDDVSAALLDAASVLGIVYAIARVHAPEVDTLSLIGVRPLRVVPGLVAAVMGACAVVPFGALQALISRRFPLGDERSAEITHMLASQGRAERIAGVIALVVVMPIADELFFRGALATGVARNKGRVVALVTTVVAFSLVYAAVFDPHYLPLYAALGLMCGVARLTTGSVVAAVVAHLAWRGADLARDLRVTGTIDPLVTATYPYPAYSMPVLVGGTVATIALALLLTRFAPAAADDRVETAPLRPSTKPPPRPDDEDDA
jgi:membrane protease YdiL (CAAX protease family)